MKHKKEIDALIEAGKVKYLDYPEIKKIAPTWGKYIDNMTKQFKTGKIGMDEYSGVLSYYMGEIMEIVYGNDAYDYYKKITLNLTD